tara:strand:- start:540 stop:857 length:318 start_codon:yes stop_codon:yes gene_type:complete
MDFIDIDLHHCFRKDEIICFRAVGGDGGDYDKEIVVGDYDCYIQFFFKNGTNIVVDFGDDDSCCDYRNAYYTYLSEVFAGDTSKKSERINEILREQNPDEYKHVI